MRNFQQLAGFLGCGFSVAAKGYVRALDPDWGYFVRLDDAHGRDDVLLDGAMIRTCG
ncbi:hypothetical protein MAHJHV65_41270 [Mycobacterium avium subsp. hominissuis]|uniref:hypothetical protein n=1 Tax=Mycobacterium avium TaxID=1764 RepID=UPI000AA4A51A|nr:hypothetical protein [Mycobacterium avium]